MNAKGSVAAAALLTTAVLAGEAVGQTRTLEPTDLGTSGLTAQGTSATASTFVRIPAGYAVRGGRVDLRFAHSPLLRDDRSTVTLLVDGRPLRSTRLRAGTAEGGRLTARLPAIASTASGFTLAARFSMRLTRDDCEDPRNAALWSRVLPSTRITARLVPAGRTAGRAAALLVPDPDAVLRVAAPDVAALAAAGTAAAALGRRVALTRPGDPAPAVALGDAQDAGLVVATGGGVDAALRRIGAGGGGTASGGTAAGGSASGGTPATGDLRPGEGVVAVARRGAPRVVVGGADAEGLRRAAASLAARPLTPASGPTAVVRGTAPQQPERLLPFGEDVTSFAQLGLGQRTVQGVGVTTLTLPVDRPAGWALEDGARLDLVLDADAALRQDASSVTVTVGGQDVGSRRLHPGEGPKAIGLDLPHDLLDRRPDGRARRDLDVALRFDLQPRQGRCLPLDDEAARVTVLDRSRLTLPHDETERRDLSRFPAPLGADDEDDTIAIVVPPQATSAERSTALQAAAVLGRWLPARTPLPTITTDATAGEARVLVGRAARDAEQPGGAPDAPGEGAIALVDDGDDGTALTVTGADGGGLLRAARALTTRAGLEDLAGRAVRVRRTGAPEATAQAQDAQGPPAAITPTADDDDGPLEDAPDWAIPAVVALVAFLAFVAALVRRRMQAARER